MAVFYTSKTHFFIIFNVFFQDIGASDTTLTTACDPLSKNGSLSLNPCGLIANSFFTGKIKIVTFHNHI